MELVILIRMPASGKSSFVRARLALTHRHVSRDLLGPSRGRVGRQRALIEEALAAGRPVVVDNVTCSTIGGSSCRRSRPPTTGSSAATACPTSTLIGVPALARDGLQIEVEAIAVLD